MFNDPDIIEEITQILANDKRKLFHACQFKDFISYIRLGGIPSRDLLENSKLDYTKFDSDKDDMNRSSWDKVFLNLSDFGDYFHRFSGNKSLPTIYGPILFILEPDLLAESSAFSINFVSGHFETRHSVQTLDEIRLLYKSNGYAKFIPELRKSFESSQRKVSANPEVVCQMTKYDLGREKARFDCISKILVDPINTNRFSLIDTVKEVSGSYHHLLEGFVTPRSSNKYSIYQELVKAAFDRKDLRESANREEFSGDLQEILSNVDNDLIDKFQRYLIEGTIEPLSTSTDWKQQIKIPA